MGSGSRNACVVLLKNFSSTTSYSSPPLLLFLITTATTCNVFFCCCYLLVVKVTTIKLGLQVNVVTVDVSLIRWAWQNKNCFYQLCQLSIWWWLGAEEHGTLEINWLSASCCLFRAVQMFCYSQRVASFHLRDRPQWGFGVEGRTRSRGLRLLFTVPSCLRAVLWFCKVSYLCLLK